MAVLIVSSPYYLRRRRRLCFRCGLSVCLSVCSLDYSQTCEWILTKFFGGIGHGSRTKWYNFGGDPDHASDPGVRNPDPPDRRKFVLCECILVWFCRQWAVVNSLTCLPSGDNVKEWVKHSGTNFCVWHKKWHLTKQKFCISHPSEIED